MASRTSPEVARAPMPPITYEEDVDTSSRRSRRQRSRNREERRSLVRLRQQGALEFPAEDRNDFPPVPRRERKCTDCLFLAIFLFYWLGMLIIGFVALQNGNPARLVYGTDYQGNVCGDERGLMGDRPYLVYPRAEEDLDQNSFYNAIADTLGFEIDFIDLDFFGVCRELCPKEGEFVCTYEAEAELEDAVIVRGEDRETIIQGCLLNPADTVYGPSEPCQSKTIQKECWEMFFDNAPVLFRCFPEYTYDVELLKDESECLTFRNYSIGSEIKTVCVKFKEVSKVTKIEPLDSNSLFEVYNTVNQVVEDLYGDVIKAQDVILGCGIVIALIIGLMYVFSLWCCVGTIVWLSVLTCVLLLLAFTTYCYVKGGILDEGVISRVASQIDSLVNGATELLDIFNGDDDDTDLDVNGTSNSSILVDSGSELPIFIGVSLRYQTEYQIAAYTLSVVTVLILLIIVSMSSRINRAIKIFAEASRCVRKNLVLLIVPPLGVAFLIGVISYWVVITAYVSTSGTINNSTLPEELEEALNLTGFDFNTKVFGPFSYTWIFNLYLLLGLLWSMAFVSGTSHMLMSHIVSKWYWSGSPDDYRTAGTYPLLNSFRVVFGNHLGSIAFGSLLIAGIQLVRYVAAFIQHRFNSVQSQNRVLRYLFMSLNCCLKCAELCIKFISKHAYVMTAMYGTSFCTSTKMVFSAISHNLAQVATVTFLGDVILRFGQILVVTLSGLSAWVYLDSDPAYGIGGDLQLSSFIFPVILTMILAWFISYEVLNVYDVAVDTILISYCQDRKLLKLRASTHRPRYNKNYTDFLDENRLGRPLVTQNSLSVLA